MKLNSPVNKIIWRGNTNQKRGFGNMTHNILPHLIQKGYSIRLCPVPYPEEGEEDQQLHESIKDLPIVNCVNNYSLFNTAKQQIFYTASEGTNCSTDLLSIENRLEEIWVPSVHSMLGLKNIGVKKKVHVIPLGINNIISPSKNLESKFTFLSVFRWNWRKAPEVLIESFTSAFKVDQAQLIIKTTRNEDHDFNIPISLPPNITIITEPIDEKHLYELYANSHAFVLPTRGEGWGLPITEAGNFQLPVITTNWGGSLDYLNPSNAFLIAVGKMVKRPRKDIANYFAEPSKEDFIHKLRFVFNNYPLALQKAVLLKEDLAKNWTWEKSAEKIIERLKQNK